MNLQKLPSQIHEHKIQNPNNSNVITSPDNYCASTSHYNSTISSPCNQNIQSQDLYMPIQNRHYVPEPTPHLLLPESNNYSDLNSANMFNDYSPDNSSYSENSDYTSDDFEEEQAEKRKTSKQHEIYSQPNYIANNHEIIHTMPAIAQANSIGTISSNLLPPFPSINSSCDLSTNYKDNHCHSYQNSSMHLNSYSSYSTLADNLSPQHTPVYYDMHSSSHYSYSNGFHKDDGFTTVSNTHLSTESGSSDQLSTSPIINDHSITQQQYIDLSLSIASSSSAESLLSAANTSDEDSRLTPISFTHIQPLTSSSSFYGANESSNNCQSSTFDQSYDSKSIIPICQTHYSEYNETSQKSNTPENNLSSNDNFGEIIKKSIVESVSA